MEYSYIAIIEFRSFGFNEGVTISLSRYYQDYNPKCIDYQITFRCFSISEICEQIKKVVKDIYNLDSLTSIKFVTSKQLFTKINDRTLLSSKTIYNLFAEQGINIEEGEL